MKEGAIKREGRETEAEYVKRERIKCQKEKEEKLLKGLIRFTH